MKQVVEFSFSIFVASNLAYSATLRQARSASLAKEVPQVKGRRLVRVNRPDGEGRGGLAVFGV